MRFHLACALLVMFAVSEPVIAQTLPPSLAPMLAKVSPAVVNISVEGTVKVHNPLLQDPAMRQFFNLPQGPAVQRFQAVGSGVIYDANRGFVITNSHVVANATKIMVTLLDRRQLQAKLVATDPESDIAVLKIPPEHLTAMPLGDSKRLRVGDYVVAIGDPFAVGQTATFGIVSAVGRNGLGIEGYEDFIQTDASVNPGNSGGALVNVAGELVGINTAILSQGGGNVGIGFAIPITMAKAIATELIEHGKVARGELGVVIQNLTPDLAQALGVKADQGAVVSDVRPGSPAAKAGVRAGDVIAALDGTPVQDSSQLRLAIGQKPPGTAIHLAILRNGQRSTVTATLVPQSQKSASAAAGAPSSPEPGMLGLELAPVPPGAGAVKGALVAQVEPGSVAADAGLQQGDIITDIGHTPVTSAPQAAQLLRSRPKGKPLLLRIARDGGALYLTING